jgi:hypothetical protein
MDLMPTYSATSMEGLFHRGLAPRLTDAMRAELKTQGIDLSRPPLVACRVAPGFEARL